jgi:hypothetical protein
MRAWDRRAYGARGELGTGNGELETANNGNWERGTEQPSGVRCGAHEKTARQSVNALSGRFGVIRAIVVSSGKASSREGVSRLAT